MISEKRERKNCHLNARVEVGPKAEKAAAVSFNVQDVGS